jgi:hypothetical protein
VMPTPQHEALVELVKRAPETALELLSRLAGVDLPVHETVTPLDASIHDLASTELRADLILSVEGRGGAGCVVIVEVQRGVDPDKPWRWPRYMTAVRDDLRRPVRLLVVATNEEVADWARGPLVIGPENALQAVVVGPGDVPRVETLPSAEWTAVATLLSAAMHVRTVEDWRAMRPALEACRPSSGGDDIGGGEVYDELLAALVDSDVRTALEAQMLEGVKDPWLERMKNRFRAEGREEGIEEGIEKGIEKGREEGIRELVVRLARSRGWVVGPEQRAKIERCHDAETLSTWAVRVMAAASLEDALAG